MADTLPKSNKSGFLSLETWARGLYMLIFVFVNYVVRFLAEWISLIQFVCVLIKGKPHDRLQAFSNGLSTYSYQILLFLTYNSEVKPFPFSDWPKAKEPATPLNLTEK